MRERAEHPRPSDRIRVVEEANAIRLVVSAPFLPPGFWIVATAAMGFGWATLIGIGALAGGRWSEGPWLGEGETFADAIVPLFVLAGFIAATTYLFVIVLHALFGKLEISLTAEELAVRWWLFGRSLAKRMPVSDIQRIKEGEVGRANRRPLLGVVVVPKVQPALRPVGWTFDFGSGLKDEDRVLVVQKLSRALEGLRARSQTGEARSREAVTGALGAEPLRASSAPLSDQPSADPAPSERVQSGPLVSDSSSAPSGCELRHEGDATVIRAKSTWRSVGFFVILLGTVLWNGLLGFWLYGLFFGDGQWVHDDGPPTWFIVVIVLFVLAGLGMITRLLSYPRSEERVRIEGGKGEVYQGSEGSGEKQLFTVASVRSVELEGTRSDADDGTIVIYADNRVELGLTLSKESRRWMAEELRRLLLHSKT